MILKKLEKIQIILLSRFKNQDLKKEKWIKEREKVCNSCEFNTANIKNISIKQKIINVLSNTLTLILTGKSNVSDDACAICTCTLHFKQKEKLENCPKGKWKKI